MHVTDEMVDLVRDAVRFAVQAAGDGFCAAESFLFNYSTASGDEDWETLADRVSAALRAAPAAEPVSVKPLEWVEDHGVSAIGPYRLFYAVTPLGRFVYGTDAMGYAYWHPPSSGVYTAGSEETAKRAAERSWEKYALAEAGKFLRLAAAPTEAGR